MRLLIILITLSSSLQAKEVFHTSCEDLSIAILNCKTFRCQVPHNQSETEMIMWEVHGWVEKDKCVISKIIPTKDDSFAYTCAYSQKGRNTLAEYHEFNLKSNFPVVNDSYKSHCEINSYKQFLQRF